MKDFRSLKVWEKAHNLVLSVYKATEVFPKYELCGLINQIRRAAVSIPTNIAEGCRKSMDTEFSRYLQIAMDSSSELEYFLLLARDLTYLKDDTHQAVSSKLIEIRKMLNTLIHRTRANRKLPTANH